MLFYKFPVINHIDDVLPAIVDSPEFIVAEKDGYKVINYMVNKPDSFPNVTETNYTDATVRRECRGIKFDSVSGNIIARPYHKFFNVGEREETLLPAINLDEPHMRLLKLDGSMVHPIFVNSSFRWCTKMGITYTAFLVEEFVDKNPVYHDFAVFEIMRGNTPIFEYCSNKNQIVLNYPEDQLILTAIRNMKTGEYTPHSELVEFGKQWNIPVVSCCENTLYQIAELEDVEGIVIRFDNGHMLKCKTLWYVLRHKSRDSIMVEKNVFGYIFNEQVDDVIPYLSKGDAEKLLDFQQEVTIYLMSLADQLNSEFYVMKEKAEGDRKVFAALNTGPFKNILFKAFNGENIYNNLLKFFASNTKTKNAIEEIRHMLNGLTWRYM